MNYKRTAWLVFYRTKGGHLASKEIDELQWVQEATTGDWSFSKVTKLEAMEMAKSTARSFKDFEYSIHGPIVKRMCYV